MTEPHSGGWLSKFCCCEGAVTERRYKSGGSIAMEISPPPYYANLWEHKFHWRWNRSRRKIEQCRKKINLFTSEKNEKDMYGERSAMSERYQYASSSWKTVDRMFIGKEVRTKKFTNSVVLSRAFNINSLICGHSKGL